MKHSLELEPLIEMVKAQGPGDDPLDHLATAVVVSDDLADLADDLIEHFVDLARETGASWAEVGERLGVSKQAAQKRYVESPRPRGKKRRGLFARFTNDARQVTVNAQQIVHDRGGRQIGSEHLLLALIADESGPPAKAIMAVDVELDRVRGAVEDRLGPSGPPTKGHIPFTADAKKTLELALREAIRLGDRHIGTDHILLGMLRDGDNPAGRVLADLGATRKAIEAAIESAMEGD